MEFPLKGKGIHQIRVTAGQMNSAVSVALDRPCDDGVSFQNGTYYPWDKAVTTAYVFVPPHAEYLSLRGDGVSVAGEQPVVVPPTEPNADKIRLGRGNVASFKIVDQNGAGIEVRLDQARELRICRSGMMSRGNQLNRVEIALPTTFKKGEPVVLSYRLVFFTSDGTIDEFFPDLVDLGVHRVVMEPTCDMALFARNHGRRCGFTGGVDTRVLLTGSRDEIAAAVTRAMEIGKPCPGYIFATGNHIPDNTPVESCLWYDEFYQKLAWR